MSRVLATISLLFGSNVFMNWAWYGHLKHSRWSFPAAVLISWLIAAPEYALQVPANRLGHVSQGGRFTASQLKILQEAITLTVFLAFAWLVLREIPRPNELLAMGLIVAAVGVAMWGRGERRGDDRPVAAHVAAMPDGPTEGDFK